MYALFAVSVVVALYLVQGYAIHRTARRNKPRPRAQYVLLSLGYLILCFVGADIGAEADKRHITWLSNLMQIVVGLSIVGVILMFGRGASHGRIRRGFWRVPPPWLDSDSADAQSAAADTTSPAESGDSKVE